MCDPSNLLSGTLLYPYSILEHSSKPTRRSTPKPLRGLANVDTLALNVLIEKFNREKIGLKDSERKRGLVRHHMTDFRRILPRHRMLDAEPVMMPYIDRLMAWKPMYEDVIFPDGHITEDETRAAMSFLPPTLKPGHVLAVRCQGPTRVVVTNKVATHIPPPRRTQPLPDNSQPVRCPTPSPQCVVGARAPRTFRQPLCILDSAEYRFDKFLYRRPMCPGESGRHIDIIEDAMKTPAGQSAKPECDDPAERLAAWRKYSYTQFRPSPNITSEFSPVPELNPLRDTNFAMLMQQIPRRAKLSDEELRRRQIFAKKFGHLTSLSFIDLLPERVESPDIADLARWPEGYVPDTDSVPPPAEVHFIITADDLLSDEQTEQSTTDEEEEELTDKPVDRCECHASPEPDD